jgi:NitT/TauT family transport system substrate-binding protein
MSLMTRRTVLALGSALALSLNARAGAAGKVRIGLSSKGLLFMPALVADAMGYFKDEGVDAELAVLGGANKVYTALVAGELEMSVSSSVSILKARASQTDLMMVGTAMNQHGSNIVVSKEWAAKFNITDASSYEDRLKALKGITIGTSSVGGGSDQLVRLLAEEAGINPDRDMTLTVLAVGDATLAAFAQRRVDAITHSSPVAVKAIRDYDGMMLFHLSAGQVPLYDGFLYLAYSASEAWLKANRDEALKTLAALQRAHRAIRDDAQRETVRKAVKDKFYPEMDEALFADSWADYVTAFPPTIDIDQTMVDRVLELSKRLQPDEPIDPAVARQAWTDDYVKALPK